MSQALPPLREELNLYPGPRLADGQPSWTLHDPVRNQFLQLDWPSFEILSRWHLPPEQIVEDITQDTTLLLGLPEVERLLEFLQANQLLVPPRGQAAASAARLRKQSGTAWTWLLHHYLFFRVPLLRPDRFLGWLAPRLGWLFSRGFLALTVFVGLLGVGGVMRDWETYSSTLVDMFTWQGLVAYGVTIVAVKVAHEFCHGLVAKRLGCRVPTMGVALMVLWPVAYTDTTEVWKLPRARQRLAVAGAGISAELVIAAWATLAWVWLPDGALKTAVFLLSSTTWISTLLVNASPFMRFDGYFLLSDFLEMPNLHKRSFALARWQLREWLFRLGDPPPEVFARRKALALIAFAWATWVYRLVLFLGIAFLVYHFFVKAVGILLFLVEMVWFIASPVAGEVSVWWGLRHRIRRGRRWLLGLPLLGLLLLLLVPFPGRVTGMGLLQPAEQLVLYAPAGAQVAALPFRHGDAVKQGELLFDIRSPELRLRAAQAAARTAGMQGQMAGSAFVAEQRRDFQLAAEQLQATAAQAFTVSADALRYAPRAPFGGVFQDLDPDLRVGDWVGQNEVIGRLVSAGPQRVVTYVDEGDVRRLAVGDAGRFVVDALEGPSVVLRVAAIERDASRTLNEKVLASHLGGQVLVREHNGLFYPESAVYRVTLDVVSGFGGPSQAWRGLVGVDAAPEALLGRFFRGVLAVFWREAGF